MINIANILRFVEETGLEIREFIKENNGEITIEIEKDIHSLGQQLFTIMRKALPLALIKSENEPQEEI